MNRSEQVAANPKEILDESMNRQESLYVPGGFEPAHLPFALSSRLARDLRPIVFVLRCTVNDRRDDRAWSAGVVQRWSVSWLWVRTAVGQC